jgi:tRNA (cytidine/uridine-2'-O-)-methyltransferase
MPVNVVLFEPEIPQNTGNIARTCACTGAVLHLVEPMGFRLTEKHLGRAGMDYWNEVQVMRWSCTREFLDAHGHDDLHLFTGHTCALYADAVYDDADTYLVFGRESRGIDAGILQEYEDRCVRIPMERGMRSLNLSNSVAIAVYEVLRDKGFPGLA